MKEIKFEDLQKANETIITTDVKGKQYAEVNQRIKAFRMVYPTGVITTEIVSLQDGVVVMKAKAYEYYTGEDNYKLLGTGLAYEKENSTFINKTSFIENAETSAIGRCLGIMGFGIDTSVASAEEVQNAINNQKKDSETTTKLMIELDDLIMKTECDRERLYASYNVKNNSKMTIKQLENAIEILKGRLK